MKTQYDLFEKAVHAFMRSTNDLLESALTGAPTIDARVFNDEGRAILDGIHPITIAHSGSERLVLKFDYGLRFDPETQDLETDKSAFRIEFRALKKPVPIVRFEYEAAARNKPKSHFQFHADSVPLGLLLARAGRYDAAAQQQDVHFPLGGPQFRLHLTDVIELLIREFGAKPADGWENVILLHRENYYAQEFERTVRGSSSKAAEVLELMGYSVQPPG